MMTATEDQKKEHNKLLSQAATEIRGTYPNFFKGHNQVSVMPIDAVERINPELARRLREAGPDVAVPIR